jgi:TetR/AcrR family transcriptional regulator
LDVAERLFAQNGFVATRLDDVAAAVGISRPTVIYYYPDKAALFLAVQERLDAEMQTAMVALPTNDVPLEERLALLLDGWFNFVLSKPNLPAFLLRNFVDIHPVEAGTDPAYGPILDYMVTLIREGQEQGKFDSIPAGHVITAIGNMMLAFFTTGPLLGGELATHPDDPEEQQRYRELLHKSFRAMLLPG